MARELQLDRELLFTVQPEAPIRLTRGQVPPIVGFAVAALDFCLSHCRIRCPCARLLPLFPATERSAWRCKNVTPVSAEGVLQIDAV